MGVRFIREPSETPNISNSADARMIRYAYGGYDGVVKGKGTELSYTIDGSSFRLNSGVINLMGYEIEIDTNGWVLDVSGVTSTRYYSVYLEVNLALQTGEIKSAYSTSIMTNYPTISTGDDLTQNTSGTARLLLYNLIVNNGIVSTVIKKVSVIDYTKSVVNSLTTTVTQLNNDVNVLKTKRTLIFDSIASSNNAATYVTLFTHSTSLVNKRLLIEYANSSWASVSQIVKFTTTSSVGINLSYTFGPLILNSEVQFIKTEQSIRLSASNTLQGYARGTNYKIINNQIDSVGNVNMSLEIYKIWIIED